MAYENLTDQLAILRRQDLSATERFVAIVALSFRNAESGRCNPPVYSDDAEKESLCSRSGYTKQCITKTLAALEAKHVIVLKKHVARPSDITFTVNDVYGKQELPSTTITATVNDVYGKGKRRLPITDKEQIKNRQVEAPNGAQPEVAPWELPLEPPAPKPADNTLKTVAQPAEKLDSHPADIPAAKAKQQKNPPIPYQKIVDLYNSRCTPTLARAKPPSDSLKSSIKARYFDLQKMTGAKTEEETLDEFSKFFDLVAESDFLCGRKTGWLACFPWLMQRQKFEAVMNGQYRNHSKTRLPPHKDPAFHFDKAYYDQSIKPDGSTDWGD